METYNSDSDSDDEERLETLESWNDESNYDSDDSDDSDASNDLLVNFNRLVSSTSHIVSDGEEDDEEEEEEDYKDMPELIFILPIPVLTRYTNSSHRHTDEYSDSDIEADCCI